MLSSYLILWHPLFLLPSIFPSIRQFSHESFACIRWPKYCSFSISPSSEYSGLIFLKIDWFDLLAVQGTFRSPLQHYSLKVSIVWCSAFFMVQLSQPYVTTGKTMTLTIWTFVGSVMSLLFNTLSRFVIAFLTRSKSSDFMAAVTIRSDLGAQVEEIWHYFPLFPFYLPCSNGAGCHDLSFLNISLKPLFHSPLSPSARSSLVPFHFLPLEWYHPHVWSCWCFSCLYWLQLVTHPARHSSWYAQHIG